MAFYTKLAGIERYEKIIAYEKEHFLQFHAHCTVDLLHIQDVQIGPHTKYNAKGGYVQSNPFTSTSFLVAVACISLAIIPMNMIVENAMSYTPFILVASAILVLGAWLGRKEHRQIRFDPEKIVMPTGAVPWSAISNVFHVQRGSIDEGGNALELNSIHEAFLVLELKDKFLYHKTSIPRRKLLEAIAHYHPIWRDIK
ncbi:hypothetical protein LX64_00707 [Chitinophaga skermanii]|uniref:Uncharacterized protein n=1 Tax=Chitinophaga skermanii TaxID=331697 RepID=A0A327R2N4_9BACT|nr:hypothetical protein [Chitinophaga skermanii]RAJ11099.1 hypothetical protein LX64_00707 [Chitinophaga skermanii]